MDRYLLVIIVQMRMSAHFDLSSRKTWMCQHLYTYAICPFILSAQLGGLNPHNDGSANYDDKVDKV